MRKKINDTRRITLDNMKDYIPFLDGRPKRDKIINTNDKLDLLIALNTCKSLKEFLKLI